MSFFGTYLFDVGRWWESDDPRVASEPWLFLNIYDGDIATIMYRPSGQASGMAFLGFTPRSYFDNGSASPPTDVELEAQGLAAWWALVNPDATDADRLAKQAELVGYLAPDTDLYDVSDDHITQPVRSDGNDAHVQVKAARFLAALGLPAPDDLQR